MTSTTSDKRRKRGRLHAPAVGFRGIVSSLAVEPQNRVLAAGTYTRWIGLYANEGAGETIAVFNLDRVHKADGDDHDGAKFSNVGGRGVTDLKWSPCGKYLYIAERKSTGLHVYDVRVVGKRLSVLKGRRATTHQRISIDLVPYSDGNGGHEISAGGRDGMVKTWSNPHLAEGTVEPDRAWKAHDDGVSSVGACPTFPWLVATCSGQRHLPYRDFTVPGISEDSESEGSPTEVRKALSWKWDYSLKLWYDARGSEDLGNNEDGDVAINMGDETALAIRRKQALDMIENSGTAMDLGE